MGIIKSILGKREPAIKYRTVDGGHPAPYPDMTDAQLYNYEEAFKVPRKTFDTPPPGAIKMEPELKPEPEPEPPEDKPEPASAPSVEPVQDNTPQATDTLPPLDLSRPVRTVTTKQPVEILTTRARHPVYKVHAYIGDDNVVTVFTLKGQLSENGPRFLENVPDNTEFHLNIYPNRDMLSKDRFVLTQHESKEDAEAAALAERLACVKVQFVL